ncbi:MAG: PIN domain-containing protein [Campylobacterota bacterium]|nr:PIN domain-containing protein [Campylobacterota bacterium]
MYKRIFLDANIIADIYDSTRPYYQQSKEVVFHLAKDSEVELFTSCDLITTLYYILSKKDKEKALEAILQINELCTIIEFSNDEIKTSCNLMINDTDYKDLEDTIQYILAKKVSADLIISNDKKFISKDLKLVTSINFFTLLK